MSLTENEVRDGAIDSTGTLLELDTGGRAEVEVELRASEATDFALDVAGRNGNWYNDVRTFGAVDTISENLDIGAQQIRIRVTSAASAGATASALLSAKE